MRAAGPGKLRAKLTTRTPRKVESLDMMALNVGVFVLDTQMLSHDFRLRLKQLGSAFKDHFAFNQNHIPIGNLGHMFPVFIHNDAADAAFFDDAADAPNFSGNEGRQTFGGFIQN
jgi:hypothetical protein